MTIYAAVVLGFSWHKSLNSKSLEDLELNLNVHSLEISHICLYNLKLIIQGLEIHFMKKSLVLNEDRTTACTWIAALKVIIYAILV